MLVVRNKGKVPIVHRREGFHCEIYLKKQKPAYFELCLGKLKPFNPINSIPFRCPAFRAGKVYEALDHIITILYLE